MLWEATSHRLCLLVTPSLFDKSDKYIIIILQSKADLHNFGKGAIKFYKYIMLVGNPHSVVCTRVCEACQH